MLDRVSWHGDSVGGDHLEAVLEWLASVRDDPLGFVLGAFPWGEPETPLAKFDGPLAWQRELLEWIANGLLTPEQAMLRATASGHGVGKSALVSMIILWAMCTFPDTKGVITANTEPQLKTKTWAELGRWFNLCWFAREFFTLHATSLTSKDPERAQTWRVDMIPWSKTNPQAFAGLHNSGKRQFMIFDEASEIADIIWETAEGFLTDIDAQRFWLAFGNPTQNTGRFRECFDGGAHQDMWVTRQIDSRTVEITDRKLQEALIRTYGGEDSDYVRIRILGQFPRQGLMEFFSAAEIDAAMSTEREVFIDAQTPLAIGVDVARYGANNSVIFPRKGRDARSIPRRVYNGLSTTELANHVFDCWTLYHPDGIFIDGGGVGGGVVDQCRSRHLHVWEIQFQAKDTITGTANDNSGERYANMRAAMYGALRSWLRGGLLPADADLRSAMLAIRYTFKKDEILLVPKEDLLKDNPGLSLDDLDALALTFGGPLAAHHGAGRDGPQPQLHVTEYNPFDTKMIYDVGQGQSPSLTWDPFEGALR